LRAGGSSLLEGLYQARPGVLPDRPLDRNYVAVSTARFPLDRDVHNSAYLFSAFAADNFDTAILFYPEGLADFH
jgi:hypothetical protein